jgi:putative heme-binding domain-containing protein
VKALRIVILLVLAVGLMPAQHEEVANPHASPQDVATGGQLFRSHCAVCHGLEGVGDRAPALTTGQLRYGSSDEALHETISRGIPGTEMPGIYFNGVEPWQLVAYVRSLSDGSTVDAPTGDAGAGQLIYTTQRCSGCHRIDRQGGRSGPDLSRIGGLRSMAHLRAALLDPDEKVLPKQWRVRARTADGREMTGRLLNEDTFSLQLLDAKAQLVSLAKSDVAEYEIIRESAMPSYASRVRGNDLENLLAYLASLR